MEQLRELLQEVLQAELAPVHVKLDRLEHDVAGLKDNVARLNTDVDSLKSRMDRLEEGHRSLAVQMADFQVQLSDVQTQMSGMQTQMADFQVQLSDVQTQMAGMQAQLDRLEHAQTEDVVGMLRMMDKKFTQRADRHEHQIGVLNERLLAVEADVRRLLLA